MVEYQSQSEELSSMVRSWPNDALIGIFMGGLKDEFRLEVQSTRSQSLLEAFEFARIAEEKFKRLDN